MPSSYPRYTEADALVFLLAGDVGEATRLVDAMSPDERLALHEAAERLADLADDTRRCAGCGERVGNELFVASGRLQSRRVWHPEHAPGQVANDTATAAAWRTGSFQ